MTRTQQTVRQIILVRDYVGPMIIYLGIDNNRYNLTVLRTEKMTTLLSLYDNKNRIRINLF